MNLIEAKQVLKDMGYKLLKESKGNGGRLMNENANKYICFKVDRYFFDSYPKSVITIRMNKEGVINYLTRFIDLASKGKVDYDTFIGAFQATDYDYERTEKVEYENLLDFDESYYNTECPNMIVDLINRYYRGRKPKECTIINPLEDYGLILKKFKRYGNTDDFEEYAREEISQKVDEEL